MGIKAFLTFILFLFAQHACAQLVYGERDLNFGDQIFPGISKSINRTDANSAKYLITGEAGKLVHITFQLPTNLNSVSSKNLSVKFSTDDAGYHFEDSGQTAATAFDPNEGLLTVLGTDGKLHIWLGATVYPEMAQEGNSYSNEISLNVTYTTN